MLRKYRDINTILFDLDGTLISPRKRLYCLFVELTNCTLSFEDYWRLKEQGLNQHDMLEYIGYTGESLDEFAHRWRENVERGDLLAKDEIFTDSLQVLEKLSSKGINIFIVTNRQSADGINRELVRFGINSFFIDCITTFQKCRKDEAVRDKGIDITHALLVGDSSEDIIAADRLFIPSILIDRLRIHDQDIEGSVHIHHLSELLEVLGFEE